MKALIVEDEAMAARSLERMLSGQHPEIEVIGHTGSVKGTVEWLMAPDHQPDIIFMDVELSDGSCFEIFRHVNIEAKVIMTTAYENYAIKAFEVNSIDYLLKPIEPGALDRAVERCRQAGHSSDTGKILEILSPEEKKEYKRRFLIRINDRLVPLNASDIAWFYSEDKSSYVVNLEGKRYIIDSSLDYVEEELDPETFFRISRSCIVSMSAVGSITKQPGGRLIITPHPDCSFEMSVSRSRTDNFLKWMEGEL